MLMPVLLLALFAADPAGTAELPDNFRDYFERAEVGWAKGIATRELNIEKAEVAHKGAPVGEKATQRRKINDMKADLAGLKKTPARAILPASPQPGDVGIVSSTEIYAVLDEKTLAVKAATKDGSAWALLKMDSTKGIKTTKATATAKEQKPYQPHDIVWLTVVPTPEQREQAVKFMPASGPSLVILEAIKPAELGKMRALFEAK